MHFLILITVLLTTLSATVTAKDKKPKTCGHITFHGSGGEDMPKNDGECRGNSGFIDQMTVNEGCICFYGA